MTSRSRAVWGWCVAMALMGAPAAFAQDPQPPSQQPPPSQTPQTPTSASQSQTSQADTQTQPVAADPDSRPDPLQPDFDLAALPTTLRLPKNRLSFRLTHRFDRSIGADTFSGFLSNFFELDSAAQIGLELRYGLLPGTQIGVYRTSDRTIEIFGQQSVMQQKPDGRPLGVDVMVTFEGTNNLQDQHSGGVALIVSRKIYRFAAVYVEPMFVSNTNFVKNPGEPTNTGMVGLGIRLRIRPKVYLVGEITPRVAGYRPGADQASVGIETRVGGHTFQLNFSNGLGTTLGQIARGGINNDSWFIGFNLSRKFY